VKEEVTTDKKIDYNTMRPLRGWRRARVMETLESCAVFLATLLLLSMLR
jgi:hypothetical protein